MIFIRGFHWPSVLQCLTWGIEKVFEDRTSPLRMKLLGSRLHRFRQFCWILDERIVVQVRWRVGSIPGGRLSALSTRSLRTSRLSLLRGIFSDSVSVGYRHRFDA